MSEPKQEKDWERTSLTSLQYLSLESRLREGEASSQELQKRNKLPLPESWQLVPHPHWNEEPYYTHSGYPIVTSLDLLSSSKSAREKRAEHILQTFQNAIYGFSTLPDSWEVLVYAKNVCPPVQVGRPPGAEIDMFAKSDKEPREFSILYVDHDYRTASYDANHLQDYRALASLDEDGELRTGWRPLNRPLQHHLLLQNCYWFYLARHPHYYTRRPEKAEELMRSADLLITRRMLERDAAPSGDTLLHTSRSSQQSLQESYQSFVDDIADLKEYERIHNVNNSRRVVRIASFLAEHGTS